MALFPRRKIQEAIDLCGRFMPVEAISRKVAELNASNEGSLPAEWEVVVAAATSTVCPLAYEPDFGGPRKGDLLLMPNGAGTPGCLVEVTAVSDEHAHTQNPYDQICDAIRQKLRKLGLPKGGTHIQVGGKRVGEYDDAKMVLQLGKGRSETLFTQEFYDFVRRVKAAPGDRHVHEWKGDELDIRLTFDPGESGYLSGGHPVYTVVHSRTRNPLANALKAKCDQLARTGHPGPFGLVICDGGCDVLSSRLASSGTSFSLRDILWGHFKKSARLSFVLVLYVETKWPSALGLNRIHHVLRGQPCVREGSPPVAIEALRRLTQMVPLLPAPVASPANAAKAYLERSEIDSDRFPRGSLTMSANKIRLSARAVLEMLSGKKTPQEFFDGFSLGRSEGNGFEERRAQGRLFTGVELIRGTGDDDELEFTFGPPDAAVSRYRLPDDTSLPPNPRSGPSFDLDKSSGAPPTP
jgi:hypothetical protein